MRKSRRNWYSQVFFGALVLVWSLCMMAAGVEAQTQTPGDNAVYGVNGNPTCCSASTNVIDASAVALGGLTDDICNRIFRALGTLPTAGGVVDARGITGNTVGCARSETPWKDGSNNRAAVILLPATTITILSPWVIPDQNKLVGAGSTPGIGSIMPGTVIMAGSTFPASAMLQMGATGNPTGISIENLTLDGEGICPSTCVSGILNNMAGAGSYVNNVALTGILGTGLEVDAGGSDSGPYSNITFSLAGSSLAGTACVKLSGASRTLGIRGLTCISTDTSADAAIYLDSSNNIIKDLLVKGFKDAILIGSNGPAHSNVIMNVSDITPGTQDNSTVEIKGTSVTDLVLMGIANSCAAQNCHYYTIIDNTTTLLPRQQLDQYVAIYALGTPLATGPVARFTTAVKAASGSAPNWVIGNGDPTVATCNAGSLLSTTGGSAALWVCEASTLHWTKVK